MRRSRFPRGVARKGTKANQTPTGWRVTPPRATRSDLLHFCPVEAPGIEPGSRGTSVPASTCVARLLPGPTGWPPRVRSPGLRRTGFPGRYRPESFASAAAESNRVAPTLRHSLARLASGPATLGRRGRNGAGSDYAARENCGSAVIIVISFLRGQLINHDTPPSTSDTRSIPDRPRFESTHLLRWAPGLYDSPAG